jgi:hypothetical protein
MTTASSHGTKEKGRVYIFEVDGQEYTIHQETITGGEIMDMAGIPRDVGLLQILADGTQKQVVADEVVKLKPGHRFKKRPRFQRG